MRGGWSLELGAMERNVVLGWASRHMGEVACSQLPRHCRSEIAPARHPQGDFLACKAEQTKHSKHAPGTNRARNRSVRTNILATTAAAAVVLLLLLLLLVLIAHPRRRNAVTQAHPLVPAIIRHAVSEEKKRWEGGKEKGATRKERRLLERNHWNKQSA